jgi:hypothetical protein
MTSCNKKLQIYSSPVSNQKVAAAYLATDIIVALVTLEEFCLFDLKITSHEPINSEQNCESKEMRGLNNYLILVNYLKLFKYL